MDIKNNKDVESNKENTEVIVQNNRIEGKVHHKRIEEINLEISKKGNLAATAGLITIIGIVVGFIILISVGTFTGVGVIAFILSVIFFGIPSDTTKLEEEKKQYYIKTNEGYLNGFENHYNQIIENYTIRPKIQSIFFIARNNEEIVFLPELSSFKEIINSGSPEIQKLIDANIPYQHFLKTIRINLKDIRYFGVKGEVENITNISGGGISYGKAIIGAALFGPVGAIVGSRKKIQTSHEKIDTREIELKYQNGELLETILFPFDLYNGLEQILPELEVNNIKLNVAKSNSIKITSNQEDQKAKKDVLNELTKLKQLLDSGAITEEEFIKLKSEILNWNVECLNWNIYWIL